MPSAIPELQTKEANDLTGIVTAKKLFSSKRKIEVAFPTWKNRAGAMSQDESWKERSARAVPLMPNQGKCRRCLEY
jgi:hypothetical protein